MKLKAILFAALAVVAGAAPAQKKALKRTKLDAAALQQPAIPQAVPADSFSYAMGLLQGPSLKQFAVQQEGVDTTYLAAFADGLTAELSEPVAANIIALAAGLKVARMNRERVIPTLNEQATGKADTQFIDARLLAQGLADAVLGKGGDHTAAQALVERQMEHVKGTYRAENEAWLVENARKEGVKTTPSGLQYKVLTAGTGVVPSDTSTVEVNYEGQLINGKVFDSSYKRGKTATFPVTGVIKGWTEALQLMPEGSVWELYIPQELAYGERGAGRDIPAYSTLIFKVELVKANAPKK
ncbi:MAG: FKBP-type peptidyl-prolyl cis-trans isomerase [Alloprevotella sp.]|nr:FKBP-type peptidyl-prolyl cis-trans isomerase [Alloprevotella sp.]